MDVQTLIKELEALNKPHANVEVLWSYGEFTDWEDLETIEVIPDIYPEREDAVRLKG